MVGRFISPTSSPPPPVPSSRQREVPLNNNFDRQIGVVHISAFDRYLAKLWALPAVSLRDGGEEQEEEEEEKAAAEEEPSPAGLASRFRLGSTFELPLYPFFPPSFSVGIFLSAQPSPGFLRSLSRLQPRKTPLPFETSSLLGEQTSFKSLKKRIAIVHDNLLLRGNPRVIPRGIRTWRRER